VANAWDFIQLPAEKVSIALCAVNRDLDEIVILADLPLNFHPAAITAIRAWVVSVTP
jgi:hypothetical protein